MKNLNDYPQKYPHLVISTGSPKGSSGEICFKVTAMETRHLSEKFIGFIKTWTLTISIVAGILLYVIYDNIPALAPAGPYLGKIIGVLQPLLIFMMLFLSFCHIEPKDLRPRKWHVSVLLVQTLSFTALAMVILAFPDFHWKVLVEGAMLCMICPTATAAAVVTGKLGGDIPGITAYTILINLATAVLVPVFVPFIHPTEGISFFTASSMILAKVFPMLIAPCLLAFLVRYLAPGFHAWLLKFKDLAFYLWGVSLMLAILMTTRSIVHSSVPVIFQAGLAAVSLICCAVQFMAGKRIGRRYGASLTAGQAMGQKNTVFAIWMGYTFMTPVTSIAGGFYCIWHNIYNSWQLYKAGKSS